MNSGAKGFVPGPSVTLDSSAVAGSPCDPAATRCHSALLPTRDDVDSLPLFLFALKPYKP